MVGTLRILFLLISYKKTGSGLSIFMTDVMEIILTSDSIAAHWQKEWVKKREKNLRSTKNNKIKNRIEKEKNCEEVQFNVYIVDFRFV